MSKEQQELLDDAYENYCKITPSEQVIGSDLNPLKNSMTWKRKTDYSSGYPIYERLTKEEFINKIKTDDEFAKKWGLSIQERELSESERYEHLKTYKSMLCYDGRGNVMEYYDSINIPKRVITLFYKGEEIEVYE